MTASTAQHADPLALERQVCFALAVTNRAVLAVYRPLLEPLGLTHPQYLVMLLLWENEPRRVHELGRELELDSGTLSPLLKRLENSGLIRRQRRADDEREVEATLTQEGRSLADRASEIPPAIERATKLTAEESEELLKKLKELRVSLRHSLSE